MSEPTSNTQYNPLTLANTIVYSFLQRGKLIRPMKLQKLLYFFIGYDTQLDDQYSLDDVFKKLDYGPVCINVYENFKTRKGDYIKNLTSFELKEKNEIGKYIYNFSDESKKEKLLNDIIIKFGAHTDMQLSEMTHQENSPWNRALLYEDISNQSIIDYFKNLDINNTDY